MQDTDIPARFDRLDWMRIAAQLDDQGHAVLPGFMDAAQSSALAIEAAAAPCLEAWALASRDLGHGELLCLGQSLPSPLDAWRAALYGHLVPLANRWNASMGKELRFPPTFDAFGQIQRSAGQCQTLSHLLRLGEAGHVLLHQHCEGAPSFPLQLVVQLSRPGLDFEGGEFVMTEQRPRMQSRPMVLALNQGDAAIVCTGERPVRGSTGCYRVNLRHAVSRVHRGESLVLALLLHDAAAAPGADRWL